ncbi:hypothetical protein [Pseudohalioglobus lutimaris]|uniref:Uncharacterized protein n=1 Tax=Pseudohalioglobus lutimaris TaxID=1737061 RepID=A0A2N5X2E9_9GAMM|nr:hypothetical protein [Pseudohalioglobus lutimaris]PLW68630.1 hypothetical protein C0039_11485 [Pseudohalioglobus lutimaris]
MRTGMLNWRNYRYGKWALLLGLFSIALYVSQGASPAQPPNGGTWQGYVLGTIGALLILWLSVLGVRKRSYSSSAGTVQGWTSAHIYLGSVLLAVATLHCAAQFGWNVHTLAYVLMCLVIFSGFYGLYVYVHLPDRVASNIVDRDRAAWLEELGKLDQRIRDVAAGSDAQLQGMVLSALELTRLGGNLFQQLRANDRSLVQEPGGGKPVSNAEQSVLIETLSRRIPDARKQSEAETLSELLSLFGRRQVILHLLRRDIRLKGLLKLWLYFHVPLTFALLAALLVHILSVFIYW